MVQKQPGNKRRSANFQSAGTAASHLVGVVGCAQPTESRRYRRL